MVMIEADLHVHTKYSFDSFLEPRSLVRLALKRGLSVIAVTDHDCIEGGLSAKREARKIEDLLVIPGIEVKTNVGDLIGLFVYENIKSKDFVGSIDEIRDQGGLAVLPHPYNKHMGDIDLAATQVDLIEVLNGRISRGKNEKARKLAMNLDKPMVGGSDAHTSFEIGRIRTRLYENPCNLHELKEILLCGKREIVGRESPFIVHGFSFATELFKRLSSSG